MKLKDIDLDNIEAGARIRRFSHPADTLLLVAEVRRLRIALAEEREACAMAAEGAMSDEGTDCPHKALEWAAARIRARGKP